jgi:hypothetical protein
MDKADRIRERHVKSFTMKTLSEHIHIRTAHSKYTGDTVLAVPRVDGNVPRIRRGCCEEPAEYLENGGAVGRHREEMD